MDRRTFLGTVGLLYVPAAVNADTVVPQVADVGQRDSGVSWNHWSFYHTENYYLVDGKISGTVPGSLRFRVLYNPTKDYKIGEREVVSWGVRDAEASNRFALNVAHACTIRDGDAPRGMPEAKLTAYVNTMAALIYNELLWQRRVQEWKGVFRDNSRLGRQLNLLLAGRLRVEFDDNASPRDARYKLVTVGPSVSRSFTKVS